MNATDTAEAQNRTDDEEKIDFIGRIPVRNLWLLMLYASKLYRDRGIDKRNVEDNPDDLPDLVAEILSRWVEIRLRRNLSAGYVGRKEILNRIRGRIDLLHTERHQLLKRGKIACRFDELTVNTIRNRYVRAALNKIAQIAKRDDLIHRCRMLAATLGHLGVTGDRPSESEMATDRFGRHDKGDMPMVSAARLAFDLALPTEAQGQRDLPLAEREGNWIRNLFEQAVGGFYDVTLSGKGWHVDTGKRLYWHWPKESASDGIEDILPSMQTDIVLDRQDSNERIVIDTKFTSVVNKGHYREKTLSSAYIYQIYAYLRSQAGRGDSRADAAKGLLLHPSVDEEFDESVEIQGHQIRFATVNLAANATEIRKQLLRVVGAL